MINKILKWVVIGGLFLIPFIPFIVSPTMLFPFITGKGFAFRIIVEIIFGAFVLLALSNVEYRPKLSVVSKALLLFAGVMLISTFLGEYPYKSFWSNYERMEGFITIIHLVMYFFVASTMFNTETWWKRFWDTEIVASVLMSLYGVAQLLGKAQINQGGVRLDARFGNASYLAIYLVFNMFITANFFYKAKNKLWMWLYGLAFALQGVILYFTATRGAILGLIGGALLTALIVAWKERENTKVRSLAKWMVGGVVALVIIFALVRNTSYVRNSPVLSRFASLSTSELETQGRYFVWPMAVKGFTERPIFGWGQENFNYVFNEQYNPAMYNQEQWFDRTHNIVLDWLIAGGLVGLIAYALIYVALMYLTWKKSRFSIEEKALITGLISAYVFHNMFVFDNLISYILFFLVLAYVHSNSVDEVQPVSSKVISGDAINYFATPIAVIAVGLMLYFVNVAPMAEAQTLIKAISPQQSGIQTNLDLFKKAFSYHSFGDSETLEQVIVITGQVISSSQAPNDVKQGFFDLSDAELTAKIKQTPKDARYLILAGSFYNKYSQYDKAITYLNDAVKYSPNKPSVYFELGTSYIGKKDYDKAFEIFQKAYNLEPRYQEAGIIYTIGALYDGKKDVVTKMFQTLGQQVFLNDDRILRTYVEIKDYNSAFAILTARISADPKNQNNKLTLAALYAQIGQKQNAINVLQQMINDDPTFKTQGEAYIKSLQ